MKRWHKFAATTLAAILAIIVWLATSRSRTIPPKQEPHANGPLTRQIHPEKTLPPHNTSDEPNITTAFFEAYATGGANLETKLDRDGLHGYQIKFSDGVLMTVSGASRANRTTASSILQESFADKFLGYEMMKGHWVELSNPHLDAELPGKPTSTTDVFPFSAENAIGLVNAESHFGWAAFVWNKSRTRLAVLSTEASNQVDASKAENRIWEIIASFKWLPINTDPAPAPKPPDTIRARIIPAAK